MLTKELHFIIFYFQVNSDRFEAQENFIGFDFISALF